MIPVKAQFHSLVAMVLFGIAMGISFDIYREVRKTFRLKPMATNIWDFLVWLIFIASAYTVLLYTNYGEVRLYIFMGIALGLLVYFRFFSRAARKPIRILLFVLLKVCSVLWTIGRIPLIFLQKVLVFPANLLCLAVFKLIAKVKRKLKALSRWFPPKKIDPPPGS